MIVADNPINNPESCFFKTKVGEAAVRAGAELMLPKESYFEQLYIGGETITDTWKMFYRPFRYATKVIGISPVKDHNLCKATVTMKNWYGLLGNPRNQFHQNIHGIISDFALMMKPTLVIADGRKLLMRNGPTGGSLNDVKKGDTIVVGTDHTAVDSWCVTRLLDKQRHDIIYLDKVIQRGLGGLASAVDRGGHGMSRALEGRSLTKRRRRRPAIAVNVPPHVRLRVTPAGFWDLCLANRDLRLERTAQGVLLVRPPAGSDSGSRNAGMTARLWNWNERTKLGIAFDSSAGFTLPSTAVRGPDASWMTRARWDAVPPEERAKFAHVCPDFVAELRSPSDGLKDLRDKMEEYITQGVRLAWLIDPQTQTVEIYRPGRAVELLQRPATLSGEDVLPGFVLDLKGILFD